MTRRRRWIPVELDTRHRAGAALVAGALASAVGVTAYYLARTLLARERVGPDDRSLPAAGAEGSEGPDEPGSRR